MFELSKEHEDFRKVVREFAEAEVEPHIAKWDKDHHFPSDLVPEDGRARAVRPRRAGGVRRHGRRRRLHRRSASPSRSSAGSTSRSASRSRPGSAWASTRSSPTARRSRRSASCPTSSPGRALAGFGLTEPDAGSDAGATRTKAVRDGDEWVVNGSKAFITNSGTDITSVVTVTARTGTNDDGSAQLSAIMIPSGTPGFTVEPAYDKLGWHASDTHGLTFEDCRVPAGNLLGNEGEGFKQFLKTLDDGRIAISALAVGMSQRMLEETTEYAKTRKAFGKPIGVNQGVSFQIADLAVMVEASRQLTYKAAWLKDELEHGRRSVKEVKQAAAICKLYSTEAAVTATRIATQVFGGNGFMEEYPVARFYRDAKILEIGEGTSEVQRMVIARHLGLPTA